MEYFYIYQLSRADHAINSWRMDGLTPLRTNKGSAGVKNSSVAAGSANMQ